MVYYFTIKMIKIIKYSIAPTTDTYTLYTDSDDDTKLYFEGVLKVSLS